MLCNVVENNGSRMTKRKYYYLQRSPPNDSSTTILLPKSNNEAVKKFFKKKFQFRKKVHWKLPLIDKILNATEKNQTVPQLQVWSMKH